MGNEYSDDEIFTLRGLVNAVKGKFSRNHLAHSLYLIALAQTGYEEDEQGFADVRYRLQKKTVYEVMDGFPKLMASSIPAGVEKIEYSVNIATIQEFIRETGESTIDF